MGDTTLGGGGGSGDGYSYSGSVSNFRFSTLSTGRLPLRHRKWLHSASGAVGTDGMTADLLRRRDAATATHSLMAPGWRRLIKRRARE